MATGKRGAQQQIAVQERRIKALTYRKAGVSYRQIADALGVDHSTIVRDVQAALADLAAEQRAEAEALRALELTRLDDLQAEATRILKATHPLVSGGKVLSGFTEDGKPIGLTDDGPKLAAIDRLLRIAERRAQLCGLDRQPPLGSEPYGLSGSDRIRAIIGLLDAARDRAARPDVIDVTPGSERLAAGDDTSV